MSDLSEGENITFSINILLIAVNLMHYQYIKTTHM